MSLTAMFFGHFVNSDLTDFKLSGTSHVWFLSLLSILILA